ncbi:PREDICTED: cullin-1-like isoform X2 [Erythranthe guttata]|uniref:cullin-1-like isoform X2 n=1 Tax=Erythranthe guttata TaxID=4155 RepID=UPI00064E0206|nr:PREDICTED: cullin-1-like isoform X2 [Erythranthe guttata]|eukprot:XP_012834973.1 PREDICTED: cullin-1-like isoform X2 [Erythranthe guttata]
MADECWAIVMESTKILRLFKNEVIDELNPTVLERLLRTIREMATHFPDQLYHSYPDIFRGYILTVLDSLRGREGKALLADFLKEWRRHNWMMVTLSPSLEDLVVPHDSLPLNQVGNECFSNVVYKELKVEILDATSSLIDGLRQQNGKMGDHFLMKRLLTSIHEIGVRDDFELELKNVVRAVCSQRASGWIENGTLVEYMVEAKEYMRKENDLICSHLAYLRENSKRNFLKVVQNQLLSTYINRLLEIGHSGPSLKENKKIQLQ